MPARRRCAACGLVFKVLPQVPERSYCAEDACQRERRKLWQRARRLEDPDYRENQARAQEAWLSRNPDYWREYRRRNPEYTQQNRERQRTRLQEARATQPLAEAQAEVAELLESGLYRLKILAIDRFAKMDVCFLVELAPVRGDGPS
jgi:hypothetical protein